MKDNTVLYVCSGRSFNSRNPGRKIECIVSCWEKMGNEVSLLCGDDFIGNTQVQQRGALPDLRESWLNGSLLTQSVVHSLSEARDLVHDKKLKAVIRERARRLLPTVIWERSCRLHQSALDVAREKRIPYVLEWKDHLVDYRFSLFRSNALRMETRKNQQADYIVVESGVLRDQLEREGIDGGKIIVAHNAVATDQFKRDKQKRIQTREALGVDDETVLVGYLGSYAFYHDTARLVLAADRIRKSDTSGKLKILMVGAGKEYPDSRKLAEHFGLLDSILIMKPSVPKDEVPGILAALDIAVLPGSTDIICPIKIQEYMAAELATIAPDYACNQEVIQDGQTGILFKPKDETDLAEKIIVLARNRELRKQMGQQARELMIKQFSWEATWGTALETILALQRVKVNLATETLPT